MSTTLTTWEDFNRYKVMAFMTPCGIHKTTKRYKITSLFAPTGSFYCLVLLHWKVLSDFSPLCNQFNFLHCGIISSSQTELLWSQLRLVSLQVAICCLGLPWVAVGCVQVASKQNFMVLETLGQKFHVGLEDLVVRLKLQAAAIVDPGSFPLAHGMVDAPQAEQQVRFRRTGLESLPVVLKKERFHQTSNQQ